MLCVSAHKQIEARTELGKVRLFFFSLLSQPPLHGPAGIGVQKKEPFCIRPVYQGLLGYTLEEKKVVGLSENIAGNM